MEEDRHVIGVVGSIEEMHINQALALAAQGHAVAKLLSVQGWISVILQGEGDAIAICVLDTICRLGIDPLDADEDESDDEPSTENRGARPGW